MAGSQSAPVARWRGCTEVLDIVALETDRSFFGDFRVRSASGNCYEVEIRALDKLANSCGGIDHRVNALGTCKHIEGVLAALGRGKVRAFRAAAAAGSPWIEVFLDRRGEAAPALAWPLGADEASLAAPRGWLRPWLDVNGMLTAAPDSIEELLKAWPEAPPAVRANIRVSRHFGPWLERARREGERHEAAAAFSADLSAALTDNRASGRTPAASDELWAPDGRGAQAMAEAGCALRMAKTLADGGFPEAAPALLARSLQAMAAAMMAARGETGTGALDAANTDICRLVECGALPTEVLAILDATRLLSSAAAINDVAPLLSSTTRILAAIGRNEPIIQNIVLAGAIQIAPYLIFARDLVFLWRLEALGTTLKRM